MDFESFNKELNELFVELCKIPAPTNHEDERINFIVNWYADNGLLNFEIDSIGNVLYYFGVKAYNPVHLITAHVDTVFNSDVELKPVIEDGNLYCPGSGDNTANVAIMMMTVKYLSAIHFDPPHGYIFAADICEEGLGNLKGIKAIVADYGVRIEDVVSIDLAYGTIINKAVGSRRYEVRVATNGGHAYHDFGKPNAIAVASGIINDIYHQELPVNGNATYNVGVIEGGTGINVIPSEAKFFYEIRSEQEELIEILAEKFSGIIENHKSTGVNLFVDVVGKRPAMGKVDETKMQFLLDRAVSAYKNAGWAEAGYGDEYSVISGSTDCNASLSRGIPSICFGLACSYGHHTLNEFTTLDSLILGLKTLVEFILN